MRKIHELKCLPEHFDAVVAGIKTFEIRKHDRAFRVGDGLLLKRWEPERGFTGKQLEVEVTYLLTQQDFEKVPAGYCIMAVSGKATR